MFTQVTWKNRSQLQKPNYQRLFQKARPFYNQFLSLILVKWCTIFQTVAISLCWWNFFQIFGTTVLAGAEQNTASGHCRKTQAIFKYFKNNYEKKDWQWLVVTDDDTLLSVPKLMDLMSCYDKVIFFKEK